MYSYYTVSGFSLSSNKDTVLDESKKIIEYILKIKKEMEIEIGTEENMGEIKDDFSEIKKELNFIKKFVQPQFFVVQTGSLVKEVYQVGHLDIMFNFNRSL